VRGRGAELLSPEEIAKRFAAGDPAATRDVLRRVRRIVRYRGFAIRAADRPDVEQRIVVQLWEGVRRPEFEPGGFWGFVESVAGRRCIDWLRAQRPVDDLDAIPDLPDPLPDPLKQVLERERGLLARAVLSRLSEPCRELVRLSLGEGRSYREISAIMGTSEGALRVRMHRCLGQAGRIARRIRGR
jgi:RNA polymerase sigma-70 factor (ECF subfamily)